MLHLSSWMTTLPMMVIGMVGVILVIGVVVLAVMLLNRLTSGKYFLQPKSPAVQIVLPGFVYSICNITFAPRRPPAKFRR